MTLVDNMGDMTLGQVELALQKYLTDAPPNILIQLHNDEDGNVGNDNKDFGTIGAVKNG